VGRRYFISGQNNQGDKLGDYTTVDAKLSYNREKMTAFFGVNNIFDKKYSEYGVTDLTGTARNYYPSPGINFVGGVAFKF
jgi:outer membrane receptor protein involved in Fe transport